jgi:hypothetical protein
MKSIFLGHRMSSRLRKHRSRALLIEAEFRGILWTLGAMMSIDKIVENMTTCDNSTSKCTPPPLFNHREKLKHMIFYVPFLSLSYCQYQLS